MPGRLILKAILTVLLCILVHALILARSPDFFQVFVKKIGGYAGGLTFKNYLISLRYAFVLLCLYGDWLIYLPAVAIYSLLINQISGSGYGKHVALGTIIGLLYVLPFAIFAPSLDNSWWSFYPTARQWITLPTGGIIGAFYGFLYRKWWFKEITPIDQ